MIVALLVVAILSFFVLSNVAQTLKAIESNQRTLLRLTAQQQMGRPSGSRPVKES